MAHQRTSGPKNRPITLSLSFFLQEILVFFFTEYFALDRFVSLSDLQLLAIPPPMAAGILESLAVPSPRPLSRSAFATMATMGPFASILASREPGSLSVFKGLAITNHSSRKSSMGARNRRSADRGAIVCERPASTTEVPDVTKATWQSLVLGSDTPVLVVFWATWCGPCRMIHPVISKISKDYEGKLKCFQLNTDENPDITTQYGIRSIPTMILFKNGEKKDTVIGAVQESTLVTCIGRFL
ncbi:putative protein-disulfide reductase [Dioscorea sansibarensis]